MARASAGRPRRRRVRESVRASLRRRARSRGCSRASRRTPRAFVCCEPRRARGCAARQPAALGHRLQRRHAPRCGRQRARRLPRARAHRRVAARSRAGWRSTKRRPAHSAICSSRGASRDARATTRSSSAAASPAATAAILLARAGWSVALVEKTSVPAPQGLRRVHRRAEPRAARRARRRRRICRARGAAARARRRSCVGDETLSADLPRFDGGGPLGPRARPRASRHAAPRARGAAGRRGVAAMDRQRRRAARHALRVPR